MKAENQTRSTVFFIVGFSEVPHLRVPLFVILLLIYITNLLGNLLVVSLICCDSHLHTPMYYFITNLSFIDIGLTTTIFPKMLANFSKERSYVSLQECLVQFYIFFAMESVEFGVLTVMAYDRYVAICNPLRYMVIMTKGLCCQLTSVAVLIGLVAPIPHTIMVSELSFCDSHQINHFFCDLTALMKISCTSTQSIETMIFSFGSVIATLFLLITLMSYVYIISIIMKIQSVQGRLKGLSTCTSHLTVVILFYGSILFMYLRPASMYSMNQNKMVALLYCAAVPLFNPIIYSLNNKELREALKRSRPRMRSHRFANRWLTACGIYRGNAHRA